MAATDRSWHGLCVRDRNPPLKLQLSVKLCYGAQAVPGKGDDCSCVCTACIGDQKPVDEVAFKKAENCDCECKEKCNLPLVQASVLLPPL